VTLDEELRFYMQTLGDARRILICEPASVDEVRSAVNVLGMAALWTVRSSPCCLPGKLLVIDEPALEASMNQAAQRAAKDVRLFP
jgi:hypothetical protein